MKLDRTTLQEIRTSAQYYGTSSCMNPEWTMAFDELRWAADRLDAMLARRDAEEDACRCHPAKVEKWNDYPNTNSYGLLPCPCCGNSDVEMVQWSGTGISGWIYKVRCMKCKRISHKQFDDPKEAMNDWNRSAQFTPAETEHRESR